MRLFLHWFGVGFRESDGNKRIDWLKPLHVYEHAFERAYIPQTMNTKIHKHGMYLSTW